MNKRPTTEKDDWSVATVTEIDRVQMKWRMIGLADGWPMLPGYILPVNYSLFNHQRKARHVTALFFRFHLNLLTSTGFDWFALAPFDRPFQTRNQSAAETWESLAHLHSTPQSNQLEPVGSVSPFVASFSTPLLLWAFASTCLCFCVCLLLCLSASTPVCFFASAFLSLLFLSPVLRLVHRHVVTKWKKSSTSPLIALVLSNRMKQPLPPQLISLEAEISLLHFPALVFHFLPHFSKQRTFIIQRK